MKFKSETKKRFFWYAITVLVFCGLYYLENTSSILRFVLPYWGSGGSDIGIVNLDSFRIKDTKYGYFRQVILGTDEKTETFQTITRSRENNGEMIVNKYNYDGDCIEKVRINQFPQYATNNCCFAISPDGSNMVVASPYPGRDIYLYNFKDKTSRLLWDHALPDGGRGVEQVHWISDSEFVVHLDGLESENEKGDPLFLFNIEMGEKHFLFFHKDHAYTGSVRYSYDNKYMAFRGSDEGTIFYKLYLYNITERKVEKIFDSGDAWIGLPMHDFSPDSFVYSVDHKSINFYSLSTGKEKRIYEYGSKVLMISVMYHEGRLFIVRKPDKSDSAWSYLDIIDVEKQKVKKTIVEVFNGREYLIDGGKKIIVEKGY